MQVVAPEREAKPKLGTTKRHRPMLQGIRQLNKGEELASTTGVLLISRSTVPAAVTRTCSNSVCVYRLDRLRQVVPHAERANTAAFLEEVINYIQKLQTRIQELESGLPASDKTMQLPTAAADPVAAGPRSQSPQVNTAEPDALLTGNFSSLPETSSPGQQANVQREKRPREALLVPGADVAAEPTLPMNPGKDSLDLAEKRLKLGEGGSIASLLSQ